MRRGHNTRPGQCLCRRRRLRVTGEAQCGARPSGCSRIECDAEICAPPRSDRVRQRESANREGGVVRGGSRHGYARRARCQCSGGCAALPNRHVAQDEGARRDTELSDSRHTGARDRNRQGRICCSRSDGNVPAGRPGGCGRKRNGQRRALSAI